MVAVRKHPHRIQDDGRAAVLRRRLGRSGSSASGIFRAKSAKVAKKTKVKLSPSTHFASFARPYFKPDMVASPARTWDYETNQPENGLH